MYITICFCAFIDVISLLLIYFFHDFIVFNITRMLLFDFEKLHNYLGLVLLFKCIKIT